jgi:2-polyprenyl-3-methyl-5-hydroxy-6-metoxy-1,4-benzoquinol methylase
MEQHLQRSSVFGAGTALMDEQTVRDFWQDHPCGDALVGGLRERFGDDYEQFFSDYDQFRYSLERHLPACFDALNLSGKRVLEIGLGQGADSESLIRRGANWTGIDLTAESVERVRTRLTLRDLPFDELRQGSVLDLPFGDSQIVGSRVARTSRRSAETRAASSA